MSSRLPTDSREANHPGWQWTARLCGWLLGGLFLWAGVAKAIDPAQFAQQIRNYQFVPWWLIHPAAMVLPWIEIVAGLLLVLGVWAIEATIVLAGLLVVFLAAIGWAMHLGLDIECGCFAGHTKVGWMRVGEDLVLMGVAALGILARRHR